ncbi:ArsR family transcriptional regulator [Aliiruegeria haliotis]|uniref:ArsR family transcriptional regulator n=1 Tax=Aliiruegeria haliotis TaxID=1280846 RepID=A0A2T0S0L1_9RHOB|nr:helix-turn-helix domain-containing protein [Aliiruegeria haliotis]PRY26968.1 ArsR family transcriptional regulator [Aliiruegeria haliotis]
MESVVLDQFTTLGHAGRLAVFRLLARRFPDAVPAGEIARVLELKPNTASVYLSALTRAGLISQTRQGTSLLYRVEWASVNEMIDFLSRDCCRGRPDLCTPRANVDSAKIGVMPDRKFNALFICVGNSARSIFAETLLRAEAGDRFNVFSAGTRPQSELNPFALELLAGKEHDISGLRAKNLGEFQQDDAPVMDFIFTVCDLAANEDCPAWRGQPISAHWGVPDPVRADGTDAEKRLAFQQAYGQLRNRIRAFSALPVETLDRASLQRRVDAIAQIEDEE